MATAAAILNTTREMLADEAAGSLPRPRTCVSCAWSADLSPYGFGSGPSAFYCNHPQVVERSPVDGSLAFMACTAARVHPCGPGGELFEVRPSGTAWTPTARTAAGSTRKRRRYREAQDVARAAIAAATGTQT